MKKMLFILNPCAGTKKANKVLADILAIFNRADFETQVYVTAEPKDAVRAVKQFGKGKDLVVCCGGDGTFNETVTGLLEAELSIPLGYIPAGSTNDFASTLKLSMDVVQAARDIMLGAPQEYDLGKWGDRYFSYIASFGAFTRVSYATPQNLKNALGHLAYVLSGITALPQIRSIPMSLELDGEQIRDEFVFGAVSNSTSVGGVITLNPRLVDLRDGKFEVTLVRMPKDMSELAACVQALQTQTYDCAAITFRSVSSLTIRQSPEVDWTLDGERAEGREEIRIENLHRAIRLVHRQEEP